MSGTEGLHLDLVQWCPTCQDDVLLEQPECLDDHGADCPDRVCVQCGEAFFTGFVLRGGVDGSEAVAKGSRRDRGRGVA